MNSLTVVGRLGKDPETRTTQGGDKVTNFSVAVDRFGKEKDGSKKSPLWLKAVVFGKLADVAQNYLVKGKQVALQGELDVQEFNDREGVKRTSVQINVRNLTLLGDGQKSSSPSEREPGDESETPNNEW